MAISNPKLDNKVSNIASNLQEIRNNTENKNLTAEQKNKQEIDKNEKMFLNLLATQLKNQTPDNPTDTNHMVQHFAQISQLRSNLQLNAKVEDIKQAILGSSNLLNASMTIGKNVIHEGDNLTVSENSRSIPLYYKPESDINGNKLEIVILDTKGTTLYSKDLIKPQVGTMNLFTWDMKDMAGHRVKDGDYKFIVRAKNNKDLKAKVYTSSQVKQAMTDGSLWLTDGRNIPLSQIYGISDPMVGGMGSKALGLHDISPKLLHSLNAAKDKSIDLEQSNAMMKALNNLNMAEVGKLVDQTT